MFISGIYINKRSDFVLKKKKKNSRPCKSDFPKRQFRKRNIFHNLRVIPIPQSGDEGRGGLTMGDNVFPCSRCESPFILLLQIYYILQSDTSGCLFLLFIRARKLFLTWSAKSIKSLFQVRFPKWREKNLNRLIFYWHFSPRLDDTQDFNNLMLPAMHVKASGKLIYF